MLFILVFTSLLNAQQVSTLQELYEALQFEKTIETGQSLLKQTSSFSQQELIEIHKYLGFAYFNLGKLDSARTHFLTILELDPQYQFDPVTTSPKIIAFFEQQKKELKQAKRIPAITRYIFLKDKRPAASLKSLFVPGWGQYFKGQKQKAVLFFSAFVGSAIFTTTAAVLEKHYYKKYKAVNDVTKLSGAYDQYNRWYKSRQYGLWVLAAVWGASVFDAMWADYNEQKTGIDFSVQTNPLNPAIAISINF